MKSFGRNLVELVLKIKKTFRVQTYVIEYVFVGGVLIAIALISHKGLVEWLGVLAVFLTFGHTSIADRLHERESKRYNIDRKVEVQCYWKLNYYFVERGASESVITFTSSESKTKYKFST